MVVVLVASSFESKSLPHVLNVATNQPVLSGPESVRPTIKTKSGLSKIVPTASAQLLKQTNNLAYAEGNPNHAQSENSDFISTIVQFFPVSLTIIVPPSQASVISFPVRPSPTISSL